MRGLQTIYCCAAVLGWIGASQAAIFVVNDVADLPDALAGDGACATAGATCTLRAAGQESAALAGADEIRVPAATYVVATQISLAGGTVIIGAGAATTIIDGNGSFGRTLAAVDAFALSKVTIRNGGGVQAVTATVSDCVFTANTTGQFGSGLFAGTATILRSTFTNNVASIVGAAVALTGGEIRDSTFAGNSVAPGSALAGAGGDAVAASGGGTLLIANSTVQGDIVTFSFCQPPPSGGCTAGSHIVLSNVTGQTAHVFNLGGASIGRVTLRNSIMTTCLASGLGIVSDGHNLFATGSPCGVNPLLGDIVTPAVPLLPLADNGGPTMTRLPLPDSAPIDAGGLDCEPTDQRGVGRPIGAGCDIGAVEVGCGNGTRDPGEACDDGNVIDGDGCDSNCAVTACGNGVITAGETCDDGNTLSGDCCDATCGLEPAGSPCAADANGCTDEVCSGTGVCQHLNNSAPCDDGNACTTNDLCAGGSCGGGTTIVCGGNPCLTCYPDTGCAPHREVCIDDAPGASTLKLRRSAPSTRDRLSFRWKTKSPVSGFDFLDPTNGSSSQLLCIYDGNGSVVVSGYPRGLCDGNGCWRAVTGGFSYRDRSASADGLQGIDLRAGASGAQRGTIKLRGRGPNLAFGAAGPLALPVSARFETFAVLGPLPPTSASRCFAASYSTRIRRNLVTGFNARSD
jgi:cysteine-rich repeat protein